MNTTTGNCGNSEMKAPSTSENDPCDWKQQRWKINAIWPSRAIQSTLYAVCRNFPQIRRVALVRLQPIRSTHSFAGHSWARPEQSPEHSGDFCVLAMYLDAYLPRAHARRLRLELRRLIEMPAHDLHIVMARLPRTDRVETAGQATYPYDGWMLQIDRAGLPAYQRRDSLRAHSAA